MFGQKSPVSPQKPETAHDSPAPPYTTDPHEAVPVPPQVTPPLHKKKSDYPPTVILPDGDTSQVTGSGSGRLAIIIDDMGSSMSEARSLEAIKVPLTFAIIPGLRVDTEVAAFAAAHTIETMIHLPMQSKGWPTQRLEVNGLLVEMDEGEIQERMSGFVQKFPKAVGANNHMGSEFTEHGEKMTAVLQSLQKHNLFFIDSVTSAGSVGGEIAQRLGVRSARRNVFLDNEQNRSYIIGQLNQAVRLAKKNGSAIAICHPHPATIAALAASLPGLAGQGITLVPASRLVK
ncbi:MAG: divergent polysaccharide deacetylase family protein [Desulfuromonadaceae bacterium]